MSRKILLLGLAMTLLCGSATAQRGYIISPKNAEFVLKDADIRYSVSFLTDSLSEGRGTGTGGSQKVKLWLASNFEANGLKKAGDSWYYGFRTPSGRVGHNVIGCHCGTGKGWIVVMAHFDHLGILNGAMYPGADANASGVAAMLSLSKMLRRLEEVGRSFGKGVLFVALDGKEQGMSGAGNLWKLLDYGMLKNPSDGSSIRTEDVSLVINIDQVGATLSPLHKGRKDYLMMLSDASDGYRSSLVNANKQAGLGLDIAFDYYGSKDFTDIFYRRISDQRVFIEHGIPSVMFTSGITFNNNKTADEADTLDYAILRRRIILMFNYLVKVL